MFTNANELRTPSLTKFLPVSGTKKASTQSCGALLAAEGKGHETGPKFERGTGLFRRCSIHVGYRSYHQKVRD